jgi:hypothetical protein
MICLFRRTNNWAAFIDIHDTVYYTTGVKRGKAFVVVTNVAKQSFVGRTASLVTGSAGEGHFKKVCAVRVLISTSI